MAMKRRRQPVSISFYTLLTNVNITKLERFVIVGEKKHAYLLVFQFCLCAFLQNTHPYTHHNSPLGFLCPSLLTYTVSSNSLVTNFLGRRGVCGGIQ